MLCWFCSSGGDGHAEDFTDEDWLADYREEKRREEKINVMDKHLMMLKAISHEWFLFKEPSQLQV